MSIPVGLAQRLRSGQGVLVAGMHLADGLGVSGWETLLRRLAQRFAAEGEEAQTAGRTVLDLVGRGRLTAALAWLRQRLPEGAVTDALEELRLPSGPAPPTVALAAKLPWQGIVTSAFDDVWERTMQAERLRGYRRLDARSLADAPLRDDDLEGRFLLHALGTVEAPETLCLSPADLRRRGAAGAVTTFLRAMFAERSFVFLGFRAGDPDLALIVGQMLGGAPTSAEHFFLYPESSAGAESGLPTDILAAELDLTPVPFPGSVEELLRASHEAVEGGAGRAVRGAAPAIELVDADELPDLAGPGDLTEWVRQQRAEIEATPPAARAPLYERMGDVYRVRLGSPVQAISCYRSSLQHEPGRAPVLAKLAELYSAHKHWRAAEEMLVKLAHTEPTPERRAQFLCRAAAIAGDELDNPVRAAQLLERALDDGPEMIEAFEALERLLAQEKNWQALARLYQKTVRELGQNGAGRALKLRAATGLADLGLRFSKDPKVALKALEAADALDPGNVDRKALMAGLYAQAGPGHLEKAVDMHHAVLAIDPDRLASYRALAELYRNAGERDRLWCLAATLTFLRKGDDELREMCERGRAVRTGPVSGPFTRDAWAATTHPDEDPAVSALFAVLGPLLAARIADRPEALGLHSAERVDQRRDGRPPTRALLAVTRWLDVPPVELYARTTERRPVTLQILRAPGGALVPALLLGGPLLNRSDASEITFTIGRHLALLRPERLCCGFEAGRDIARIALEAALYLAGLRAPSDRLRAEVEGLSGELRGLLDTNAKEALVHAGRELLGRTGGELPNVDRWCNGVELSSGRAAFALVNDLGVAARALAADAGNGGLSAKQRLKDLVSYSVSQEYFQARRLLGLGRGVQ
jgi:tetratricopeptide (TPR) repeat protein